MADNDVTRIAGNIGAMNALYALTNINKQLSIHQTRLATGKRINSAADDPAGLAISTKMLARSEGLKTALSNIGDAKNLLAVAESGLGRLNDILNSMRNITEQASSDTLGTEERNIVKEQLASYAAQIDDIVNQTKWSDKQLISGDYNEETSALVFQTGADSGETTKLFGLQNVHALNLGLMQASVAASNAILSTTAIGDGLTAGMSTTFTTELASGTYRVSTTFGSDGSYTAHLLSGTTGTNAVATATGTYTDGSVSVMNFDNGLTVSLATNNIFVEGSLAELTLDDANFGTDVIATAVVASGGTELADGTYALAVSIEQDDGVITVTLDGEAIDVAALGTYEGTEMVLDLGNGIQITLGAGLIDSGDYAETGDVEYTASVADQYNLDDSDAFSYTQSVAARAAGVAISQTTVGTVTSSLAGDFSAYMDVIDAAVKIVNAQLSKIGSLTGSLTFKEDQVSSSQINVEASYNRIMNANMAEEQVNASKLLILQQTSTAMLAQANAAPQFLLSLFK